ncbi:recombinase RecT [Enterobacter ludwigii]|uniref:recombinase RecT n=1 Tax=Enterobacter ludwigii TaxID=299767 RepID=UPI001E5ED6E2|nr:recombinase RecT [Enterobacter ludwigii]MCE1610325.1 recombinase RecT [Enterobacter ludwigii]MCE1623621.1 recombinase RecT [Enterobacter ludwigii]
MSNMLVNIKEDLDRELVQVQNLLPAHVSFDRFTHAASVAIANSEDLKVADRQSVINALVSCAKDGLIPDNRESAIVVFSKKAANGTWYKVAQYMPMIDGVLKRARQSGEISIIATRVVYENDKFRAWLDDNGEHILYEPTLGERGSMLGALAYAKMKTGEFQFEWMNLDDINKVRLASKNSDKGPWVDWFESMSRKSVMHRLCRRLPNNSEIMEMLERGTEMVWQKEKDITPVASADRVDIQAMDESPVIEPQDTVQKYYEERDVWADDFRQQIEDAQSTEVTTELRQEVETKKEYAGIDLYTELKGKVVQRHHHLTAVSRIKKMINELPKPDQPEAAAKFMAVENTLNAVKVHLGDLYDGYCTTLADMKPEYIGA